MKRILYLTLLFFISSSILYAQNALKNELSFSLNISSYKYTESYYYNPSDFDQSNLLGEKIENSVFNEGDEIPVMELNGVFIGAEMNYKYFVSKRILLSPSIQYRYGMLKYKSDYYKIIGKQTETTTISGVKDHLLQLECPLGYSFSFSKCRFVPEIGLGYRYLYDNQRNGDVKFDGVTVSSKHTYNRFSQYIYIPIGGEIVYSLSGDSFLSFFAQYNYFIRGKQTSLISDGSDIYNDLVSEQKSGFGFVSNVEFEYRLHSGKSVFVRPFFELWDIRKSESADPTKDPEIEEMWYEPDNTTTNLGFCLGLVF